jgi:hypothetical protein
LKEPSPLPSPSSSPQKQKNKKKTVKQAKTGQNSQNDVEYIQKKQKAAIK